MRWRRRITLLRNSLWLKLKLLRRRVAVGAPGVSRMSGRSFGTADWSKSSRSSRPLLRTDAIRSGWVGQKRNAVGSYLPVEFAHVKSSFAGKQSFSLDPGVDGQGTLVQTMMTIKMIRSTSRAPAWANPHVQANERGRQVDGNGHVGQGREQPQRGGPQPQGGCRMSRGSSSERRVSRRALPGVISFPGGAREVAPSTGACLQRQVSGPSPEARLARGPRARPTHRASSVRRNQKKRCKWGPTCPTCGQNIQPTHSNPHNFRITSPAGSAYDGNRLKMRSLRHASQNPRGMLQAIPQHQGPPPTYAEAVRRGPSTTPTHNSRGAFGPSRKYSVRRVCVRVCVWMGAVHPHPDERLKHAKANPNERTKLTSTPKQVCSGDREGKVQAHP